MGVASDNSCSEAKIDICCFIETVETFPQRGGIFSDVYDCFVIVKQSLSVTLTPGGDGRVLTQPPTWPQSSVVDPDWKCDCSLSVHLTFVLLFGSSNQRNTRSCFILMLFQM